MATAHSLLALTLNPLKSFLYYLSACLISVFAKREDLYIVGSEYGDFLDKNSLALIKSLEASSKDVIVVLNSHTIKKHNNKNVRYVPRGSFVSFLMFFKSKGVFYSHSISDILPFMHYFWLLLNILPKPKIVFIQHGIIGLKVDFQLQKYLVRQARCFDYMTAVSELEKDIICDMGVPNRKIKVTGLARYDQYTSVRHVPPLERILVFLTWDDHVESYDRKCNEIRKCLFGLDMKEGRDFDVIHHAMMKRKSKVVRCHDQLDLNGYSMLITDQSSIAWDFVYLRRRVIFFQPNRKYSDQCKVIINANEATTVGGLEKLILKSTPNHQWKYMFQCFDQHNSERILALVD